MPLIPLPHLFFFREWWAEEWWTKEWWTKEWWAKEWWAKEWWTQCLLLIPVSQIPVSHIWLASDWFLERGEDFFVRHGLFGRWVGPAWVNGQRENLVRSGLPERVGRRRGFLARVKEGLSEPVRPR
jgi:hypothetical protein